MADPTAHEIPADELAEATARRTAATYADHPGVMPGSPAAAIVWAIRQLDERGRELERLLAAGDALMAAARSLAYAWETDTPDRVMWDEWAKVQPAIQAWVDAHPATGEGR